MSIAEVFLGVEGKLGDWSSGWKEGSASGRRERVPGIECSNGGWGRDDGDGVGGWRSEIDGGFDEAFDSKPEGAEGGSGGDDADVRGEEVRIGGEILFGDLDAENHREGIVSTFGVVAVVGGSAGQFEEGIERGVEPEEAGFGLVEGGKFAGVGDIARDRAGVTVFGEVVDEAGVLFARTRRAEDEDRTDFGAERSNGV